MLYPKSALLFFLPFFLASPTANAAREFSHWEEFDLNSPLCERPIALGVGRESFFEIANEVPGQFEYNQIIRLFRERKWEELAQAMADFKTQYESSPLREALTFLEAQAQFDQGKEGDENREKLAERKMRSALLLYPQSEFAPVLAATAAAYWLRIKNYQRSLGAYEVAATSFPSHALACTFQMGIAETQFLLRQWPAADKSIQTVLSECRNFRLRSAAVIRKADSDWLQDKEGVEKAFEKILADENPFVERFYQPTLANLAEIKYRAGKWDEARFYFERYLRTEREESDCKSYALKRLADVSARLGKKPAITSGLYLATYEKYPKADVGRFAYAHGLLTDPALKAGAELHRRIRLADEQAEQIKNEDFRSRIYVEKGITLLELGETSGLDYLTKLRGKTGFAFEKGKSGQFIRDQIVRLFEAGKIVPLESNRLFSTLEQINHEWLKGTEKEPWVAEFYGKQTSSEIVRLLEAGEIKKAVERLVGWTQSPLWPKQGPSVEIRHRIGDALLKKVYLSERDGALALAVSESRSVLEPILAPDYKIVLWLADLSLSAKSNKNGWLKWERDLATVSKQIPPPQSTLFRLASAKGLRMQGNFNGASTVLEGLQAPEWKDAILGERIHLAIEQGQGDRAFELLKLKLETADGETKKTVLKEMAQVISDTKSWSKAGELTEFAKTFVSDRNELGGYYHLAGRALFETGKCKQALPLFENALRMNTDSKQGAESRFRMGKCWLAENKPEAARQEWQKAVDLKDSFWSPLAQGEIKLLSP